LVTERAIGGRIHSGKRFQAVEIPVDCYRFSE